MPEWLEVVIGVAVFVGVFWLTRRLLRTSQKGNPRQRGRDSSEPGGYYTDTF